MYLSGLCDDLFVLSRPMKSGLCGHEVVVHVLQLKTPLCFFFRLFASKHIFNFINVHIMYSSRLDVAEHHFSDVWL